MKRRLIIAFILVVAAFFVGRQANNFRVEGTHANASEREQTRQSFRLGAGARVEVRGINGSVEIKTSDADAADVQVTYEAHDPADLEGRRVLVEQHGPDLVVRGESSGDGFWRWLRGGRSVRAAVVMTVPRRVGLVTRGVNGPVEVGAVEGPVEVSGVNGRVEVAEVAGRAEFKGVNGNVSFGLAPKLDAQGLEVKGVNGNVEVRLRAGVDADLDVKGHNGRLSLDVPNVTMQEREGRSRVRARLGEGGAPMSFRGINGNVRLASAGGATTTAATAPAPPDVPADVRMDAPPPPPPPPAPHD